MIKRTYYVSNVLYHVQRSKKNVIKSYDGKYIWNDFPDVRSISYLYKSWLGPVVIRLFDKHFGSDFNGEIVICIS